MSQTTSKDQPNTHDELWWHNHRHMHGGHFSIEELYQRFKTRQAAEASAQGTAAPDKSDSEHRLEVALYWGAQYRVDETAGKPLSGHERSVLALTEEVHRLRALIQRWQDCCTGRHGSQAPCVNHAEPQDSMPWPREPASLAADPPELHSDKFIIMSESERGFWSNEEGWVYDKASAVTFPSAGVGPLPMSKGNDAKVIPFQEAPKAFKG